MTTWHNTTQSDLIVAVTDGVDTQSHIVHAGDDIELDAKFDDQVAIDGLEKKGAVAATPQSRRSVPVTPRETPDDWTSHPKAEPTSGTHDSPPRPSWRSPGKP